ncbi:MAG: TonB-dependent receptor [Acidobacteria bacterium]|nr:TonB-dependent receptor [Acidobacteriota bacterium]
MRHFLAVCLVAVVVSLTLVGAVHAQSQSTTGMIEGRIVDPDGVGLPGATVQRRNTGTNYSQTVFTQNDGSFRAPLLPLGPYEITASIQGFSTLVREGVSVTVGSSPNIVMQLQVAAVQESLTVTAETPLIETTRPEAATKFSEQAIEGLPNNGRNFLNYMQLTPGVSIVQGPDGDEITVNGQKGIQNNISVDGADFNNPFFGEQRGGQRPAFTFNIDAVQEFVIVTDGASAEFGRASAGFINVITRSGTNRFNGTANAYFKGDALSGDPKREDGSTAPEDFNQQQVGATFGGPIKRDELFFFTSVDSQRRRSTKQLDPNRIEQRVVDALAALGSPNENGPIERTQDARVFLGKVDWHANADNRFSIRYAYTWSEHENGTFDVDSWGRSANAIEKDNSNAVSGSLITTLSDSFFNEFRFQFAREDRPRPYNGPNISGQNRPLPDVAFDFGSQYRFGMPFFIPVDYHDTRIQLTDNVTLLKGNHLIKIGAEWNRTNAFQTFRGFFNARFVFSSTDGFLNYLANPNYVECADGSTSQTGSCPAGVGANGPVLLYLQQLGVGNVSAEEAGTQDITQNEIAFFVQDSWTIGTRLAMDYGLRWESQIQPPLITPIPDLFYTPFIGQTRSGQQFPGDGTIPSDLKMFQPRVGLSWDPAGDGLSVVRLSAGIYNARIPGLNMASSRSTDGSRGQELFRNSELGEAGILPPPPPFTELITQAEVGDPFRPGVFVFDKNFQNPDTYAFHAGYEREVVQDLSLGVKVSYNKTEHLTRFTNRNDPLLGAVWSTGLTGPGDFNGVGTLTTIESTARSEYVGLTLTVRKRLSNNYMFDVNYTLSKDQSDDDNERDPFTFTYAKITDLGPEFGYSNRDQRHRFNAYLLTTLPHEVNFNARYSYRSAQPFAITATGDPAATPQDRINADGSVTQRNLGRKDNEFSSLDLRLSKLFDTGTVQVEAILDVFNLFGSVNVLQPQTTNLIFNFDGTVQAGAGRPREAQFGVRVIF